MPKNKFVILTISALMANTCFSAAHAQERVEDDTININDYRIQSHVESGNQEPIKIAEKLDPPEHKSKGISKGKSLLAAPRMVGGIISGITVGVPVRIAHDVSFETKRMREQLTDDMDGSARPDFLARTIGSCTGVAYGVVSGVIKGSIKGTERALECGARKPFSQESMSLKDTETKPEP